MNWLRFSFFFYNFLLSYTFRSLWRQAFKGRLRLHCQVGPPVFPPHLILTFSLCWQRALQFRENSRSRIPLYLKRAPCLFWRLYWDIKPQMYLSRKERSKLLSFCSFSGDSWRDKRNNGRMDCSSVRALKVHNPPFRDCCILCWRGVLQSCWRSRRKSWWLFECEGKAWVQSRGSANSRRQREDCRRWDIALFPLLIAWWAHCQALTRPINDPTANLGLCYSILLR